MFELADPSVAQDVSWQDDARCTKTDPDLFFLEQGGSDGKLTVARAICAECSVAQQCAAYAVANGIQHGIWGGLTPTQRRKQARELRRLGAGAMTVGERPPVDDELVQKRREKMVHVLRTDGVNVEEIAEIVGLPAGQVRSILGNRAA